MPVNEKCICQTCLRKPYCFYYSRDCINLIQCIRPDTVCGTPTTKCQDYKAANIKPDIAASAAAPAAAITHNSKISDGNQLPHDITIEESLNTINEIERKYR